MVSLVVEGSGSVNFFDHAFAEAPLGEVGFAPGTRFTIKAEVLTYVGPDQVGFEVYFRHDAPDNQNCFKATWITPSGSPFQAVTGDFAPPPNSVEWTGTAGATGCLDFTRMVTSCFSYTSGTHYAITWRVTLTYVPASLPPAYCAYGTRAKAGTPLSTVVTPDVISTVLSIVRAPWAVQVFAAIALRFLDVADLCARGPVSGVTLDMSTWTASAVTLWETFKWASWWSYCECIPGTPAATPPPLPVITQPPAWPAPVTFSCDPALICDTLLRIQQQLSGVQSTAQQALEIATLIQRYQVPFEVIPGAVHSGLFDSGAFAVSRLIGFQIEITARNPGRPTLVGQPPYLWDMGWISISDGYGMLQEKRLTRDHQLWLAPSCQTADRFGYYLTPGTTINVTEIEAEP